MCGIAGIARHDASAALVAETSRMLAALAHRGPDDAGILAFAPAERLAFTLDRDGHQRSLPPPTPASCAGVALGTRRLAIIDLSAAGHQPMVSIDHRYAVVLNGEIYNYVELRQELEARGRRFRSRSDTEVLLGAFEEWGAACLPRLVGMFAFVILDLATHRMILARDPFGVKPLYYAARPGMLAFASEIPPLLPLLGGDVHADPQQVYDYLESGITDHGTDTMFAGVRAIPPAHYALVNLEQPDHLDPVPYWRPDLDATLDVSFDTATNRLRELFLESVALHLRSDVRVGALLSGGIDSSAIVMAMRHLAGPGLDLHTFSYVGGQGAVSEEPWIDLVNTAAGAVPHKVHLQPQEFSADLAALVETQNEPFGSIAIYAQNRVFRRVAGEGVKVVLDGQGADELLAGYRSHWMIHLASLLERGRWGAAYRFWRQLARARQPLDPTPQRIALLSIAQTLPSGVQDALRRGFGRSRRPWIDSAWCRRHGVVPMPLAAHRPWTGDGRLRRELWRAVTTLSLPALLRYEDRNAMAHSVESRLPFLTTALAEFVLALPAEYVIGADGTSKHVFREAMRGIVPDPILDRRDKIGFAVPVRTWLPAIPGVLELLEFAARMPPVNGAAIAASTAAVRAGRVPSERASFLLWRLAGLAAWARQFDVALD